MYDSPDLGDVHMGNAPREPREQLRDAVLKKADELTKDLDLRSQVDPLGHRTDSAMVFEEGCEIQVEHRTQARRVIGKGGRHDAPCRPHAEERPLPLNVAQPALQGYGVPASIR